LGVPFSLQAWETRIILFYKNEEYLGLGADLQHRLLDDSHEATIWTWEDTQEEYEEVPKKSLGWCRGKCNLRFADGLVV
jgi:hypothetical protein